MDKINYVYVARNRLMPGYCKVGATSDPNNRERALYGDWKIIKTWKTHDAMAFELQIKKHMRKFIAHGFELFNCPCSYLIQESNKIINKIDNNKGMEVFKKGKFINKVESPKEAGKYIRGLRKKTKLTIMQLSGLSQVGYRCLQEIETGKETTQFKKIFEIAKSMGVTIYFYSPNV